MIRLVPLPLDPVRQPLESVLEQAVDGGAPSPVWVAVEDEAGKWLRFAAAASPSERAGSVAAVTSEAALIAAVRLGIGGAMWIPPSTPGATAALEAAASCGPPSTADEWIADLAVTPGEELLAVTLQNRPFWRCQLGAPALTARLVELARELEVLPAVVSWPALLLAARPADDIHAAWDRIIAERREAAQGIEVVPCDHEWGHCGVVTAAMRALATREPEAQEHRPCEPQAVFELPSGELQGRWAPAPTTDEPAEGVWLATPEDETEAGFRWRLSSKSDAARWAVDVVDAASVGEEIPRVPGWLAAEVGTGRPAALLVERLVEAADRADLPLWVPNVDQNALQHLLRLPGTFWVDGAAVPESEASSAERRVPQDSGV